MKEDSKEVCFEYAVIGGERYMGAPAEFIEYLRDCGYEGYIEMEELMDVLDDWINE